jgi:hypothetical protein
MDMIEYLSQSYLKPMNIYIAKATNNNCALLLEYLRNINQNTNNEFIVSKFSIIDKINLRDKQIKKCLKKLQIEGLLEYAYFYTLEEYSIKLNQDKYIQICGLY